MEVQKKRGRGRPTKAEAAEIAKERLEAQEKRALELEVAGNRRLEEFYTICAFESQGMELWQAYKKVRNLKDEGHCRNMAADLLQNDVFCGIRARFLEARARELESIKTEITAMYLKIMRNEELPTKDRVMAGRELSEMCGFKTQRMEVMVDTVAEFAKLHLARTSSEPLVLESSGEGEVVDV